MRRGVWVKPGLWSVVFLLVLGLAGCWNPFGPDKGGGGNAKIDRKSPDHLLDFFATKYVDKDLTGYEEAIDEDYTFTFDPKDYDAAGVSAEKPYWGRSEDVDRTNLMFNSASTKAIVMDFSTKVVNWIAATESTSAGFVDGFMCRIEPKIDVTIEGQPGEEPVTKQVRKSVLDITVIPDRHNANLWTILHIVETVKEG